MLNGLGNATEIDQLQKKLATQHNVQVKYNGADLIKASEVEMLVKDTVAQFKSIDILVSNAGMIALL